MPAAHLILEGAVHVSLPPVETLALFTPQGECEWVPDWDPTFPAGIATDEPGTTFLTQHRGTPTFWVIVDRTEHSMRYVRMRPDLHAGTVEVHCEPDETGTRVEVTYDLTALGADEAVIRFGDRFEAMLTHWEHLIAVALAARTA